MMVVVVSGQVDELLLQKDKKCVFSEIEFKYYTDDKCEKLDKNTTEKFNKTFYSSANKFKPNNDCQPDEKKENYFKWICDDEQIKYV